MHGVFQGARVGLPRGIMVFARCCRMVEDNPDGATLHPGTGQAFASFWVVPRLAMAQARLDSLDCFGR